MTQQLDALGVPHTWIEAVWGKGLPPHELAACIDWDAQAWGYHQALTPGEIGCYLSHRHVWQRVVDGPDSCALVLEDDMTLLQALPAVLSSIRHCPAQWDMIKLVGRPRERALQAWWLPQPARAALIRYARVPTMTGAYLVSREGARKLLATRTRFFRPIDIDLRHWWEGDLRVFGVLPYPVAVGPDGAISSIGHREPRGSGSRTLRKVWWRLVYNLRNFSGNHRLMSQADPFEELVRGESGMHPGYPG